MPPAETAVELMERRARMLTAGARDDPELARVTDALEVHLAPPARIRRVVLDGDERHEREARRLAELEPVNPVRDEDDLRDRFAADRRVFVLVHDTLGGKPANVVWVALRRGLPDGLADILDPSAPTLEPEEADTAVYYSIWNAEPGLAGMGGGRELIESVAATLDAELTGLQTHVTLSPVPGLRRWLDTEGFDPGSPPDALDALCARYLCTMRADGRPLDPVARFHLGNGARLLRVLTGADRSERGSSRSWGAMANYRYEPEDRRANRQALGDGDPALGDQVRRLLER